MNTKNYNVDEYLDGFWVFKEASTRYKVLPHFIAKSLVESGFNPSNLDIINILDLGCGDLSLTCPLLAEMRKAFSLNISVDLIDISEKVKHNANQNIQNLNFPQISYKWHFIDMYDYLLNIERNSKEFILISHSLYMVSINKWEKIISMAQTALTKGGVVCVVLRSRKGQLWEIFDEILDDVSVEMDYSNLFAENLDNNLFKSLIKKSVTHAIPIKNDADLFRILEFLYRLPKFRISNDESLKHKILSVANNYRCDDMHYFEFEGHVFIEVI